MRGATSLGPSAARWAAAWKLDVASPTAVRILTKLLRETSDTLALLSVSSKF
jgi:hypothetical protein